MPLLVSEWSVYWLRNKDDLVRKEERAADEIVGEPSEGKLNLCMHPESSSVL